MFVVIAVFNDFGEWSYPIIVFTFIGALFAIIGSPFCLYATRATRVPQARSPEEDRADFGEWSYPIIVFTFIGALFAIIGSPFCLYATRATRVPQARSPEEDRAVRNKVTAVVTARKKPRAAMLGALVVAAAVVLAGVTYVLGMRGHVLLGFAMMVAAVVTARKKPRAAMLGALVVAAAVVLAGVTYVLGMRGHVLLGFAMMVAMVVVPFVILTKYQDAQRRRFMKIAHAAQFVDVESDPWVLLGFAMMVAMVVVPFVILTKYQDAQRRRFMKIAHAAQFVDVESDPWTAYRPDVRQLRAPLVPVPTGYGTATLDFLYNWLRVYMMTDRLSLVQYSANDLRNAGFAST